MKHLTYYADPMCSWCWGFAPEIDLITMHFGESLPLLLVMGGLRPGTTEPMTPELKASIRGHWQHVHERSGQPFDFSFFDWEKFVYDTAPACKAVITVRTVAAKAALPYFRSVQKAFYAEGEDVTKSEILARLASDAGIDRDAFLTKFHSLEIDQATSQDFLSGPRIGVTGYPTLLAEDPIGPPQLVTAGYRKLDDVIPSLEDWLEEEQAG